MEQAACSSTSATLALPSKSSTAATLLPSNNTTSSSSTHNPAVGGDPGRRSSLLVRRGSNYNQHLVMKESDLQQNYQIIKQLGNGRFGSTHLAVHRDSGIQIALRIYQKNTIKQADFLREYNFSYFLSPHQSIIETYEGSFTTHDSYYFVQEFSERGSLRDLIDTYSGALPETIVKTAMSQVISALEFMHSERLVHRNLKAENVLMFSSRGVGNETAKLDRVKLSDFALTRKEDTMVKHADSKPSPYHAPELSDRLQKEGYLVDKSVDVWALAILIWYCLRGRFPWSKASIMVKPYWEWEEWIKRNQAQLPKKWGRFTDKAMKLFKKALQPKARDRASVKDCKKYLKDKWLKELKSISEDDLNDYCGSAAGGPAVGSGRGGGGFGGRNRRDFNSPRSPTDQHPDQTDSNGKRKSILHQWVATTLTAMSEISEQMVSAED